ncbi:MAG: hypothetical protein ABIK36_06845 [Pseudomonadota bacterium]
MDPNVIPITRRLEEAWLNYVECARRAQRTLRKEDGWRAGQAWAHFIDLFVPNKQRSSQG